jgi:hypothetical protein
MLHRVGAADLHLHRRFFICTSTAAFLAAFNFKTTV